MKCCECSPWTKTLTFPRNCIKEIEKKMVRLRFFMKNKIRIKSPKWQGKFLQQKWCFSATREPLLNGKTQYGKCLRQKWVPPGNPYWTGRHSTTNFYNKNDVLVPPGNPTEREDSVQQIFTTKWCFSATREPYWTGRLSTANFYNKNEVLVPPGNPTEREDSVRQIFTTKMMF